MTVREWAVLWRCTSTARRHQQPTPGHSQQAYAMAAGSNCEAMTTATMNAVRTNALTRVVMGALPSSLVQIVWGPLQ